MDKFYIFSISEEVFFFFFFGAFTSPEEER